MFLREWRAGDALYLLQIYTSTADLERQIASLAIAGRRRTQS